MTWQKVSRFRSICKQAFSGQTQRPGMVQNFMAKMNVTGGMAEQMRTAAFPTGFCRKKDLFLKESTRSRMNDTALKENDAISHKNAGPSMSDELLFHRSACMKTAQI